MLYICRLLAIIIVILIIPSLVAQQENLPACAGGSGSNSGLGRSPREEMATHCSILAWKISWTEEPNGWAYKVSNRTE